MSTRRVVGLLHPGEMGAAVGRCLAERGHTVLWASAGRSPMTSARADAAGLVDAGTPAELAGRAEVVVSVCPPHAALDVAGSVPGFRGTFVDANAVSPATASQIAVIVSGAGASYTDGGIIGPPPLAAGSTRMYLCGPDADLVRVLFDGTPLDARVVTGGGPWAASALKMAYAAWTKGSAALLLTVRALARAEGVEDALLGEWLLSQPDLDRRTGDAAVSAAAKGWRWVAEMEQIAQTMTAAGLPGGFHLGAAEVFGRSPRAALARHAAIGAVIAALTGDNGPDR